MSLDDSGRLGYWEQINPLYTTLNKEKETFSCIWTNYANNFETFYADCIHDINQFCTGGLSPKPHCPENIFTISSMPWVDFTAFNINTHSQVTYLLPIFTIGKYLEENGKVMMPLAIQVHHAVCDGFHVGKLINSIKHLIRHCEQWLR